MAYNPLTDFQAAMQRAQGNTGYENYGREFFDPLSGMNFMRGAGGANQDWVNQSRFMSPEEQQTGITFGMAGIGQGDMWRAYDGAAGREAHDNFALNGLPYYMYGQDEDFTGQDTWKDLDKNTWMEQFIPLAMMAAPIAMTIAGAGAAAGGAAGAAGGAGSGAVGSGAGFVGEGALSGIGAWDGALAAAPSWSGAAGAAGGAASLGGGGGVPPPANPYNAASYLNPQNLANVATSGSAGGLLGPAAALYGAVSGAQGTPGGGGGGGGGGTLDSRAEPYIYGSNGLFPQSQGLLNAQAPQANAMGQQVTNKGAGLLGAPVAGNGFGQIQLDAPNTPTNPYATGILDDLQRRNQELISKNLQSVKGNAVGVGGLGGSRQGVAEAQAITQGADNFTGQAANFMGGLYNSDQGRALQKYQGDQSFYGNQRGQDLSQAQLGSNFIGQGFQQQWQPFMNASDIYRPYTGLSSASGSNWGGGWQGAAGGLLGGLQFGKSMGWWG